MRTLAGLRMAVFCGLVWCACAVPGAARAGAMPPQLAGTSAHEEGAGASHGGENAAVSQQGQGSHAVERSALTLEDLERIALASDPRLAQALARTRAAEGRKRQAGLYPNPTVGYRGEEIRGGAFRGGEQGFFVQQDIVLGGKLGLGSQVAGEEIKEAETSAEEQKQRVLNRVRGYYAETLAAQRMVELREQLRTLAQDAAQNTGELFNVGQADEPDVLQAQVEADEAELAAESAAQNQRRAWKSLATAIGRPEMPQAVLAGDLENAPELVADNALQTILQESPAVRRAEAEARRAETAAKRARREAIPDLQIRGGLEDDRELAGSGGRPIGTIGFAEVGVRIPLFNRNQGNIAAAEAEMESAKRGVESVRLELERRAAEFIQNYATSRAAAEKYKMRMIPRAQKAYELYRARYSEGAAAYPQVLIAQRTLFRLQVAYVRALEVEWTSGIALEGFLLGDGTDSSSSSPASREEN